MNLFGRFKVKKRDPKEEDQTMQDVQEEKALIRELQDVSGMSRATLDRIDKIVNIERVRLRNLELRAEVLGRVRID